MIDPHVHLRDWEQSGKESVFHGIQVAWKAGLTALFEMPNTVPPLTRRNGIEKRLSLGDSAIKDLAIGFFHGVYAGVTDEEDQLKEIVCAWRDLFPRVVGLKMFAGHSTGRMGLVTEDEQRRVYRILTGLEYTGVLAVHCEKESCMYPEAFDPVRPWTHGTARPAEAEVRSVEDQVAFARDAGFTGVLHICHVSVPETLRLIEQGRNESDFRITCGITPHHSLLSDVLLQGPEGLLFKVNPPLREEPLRRRMLEALLKGRIDWIETDHAPHTLKDKTEHFASGLPGLPFYPRFIRVLKDLGASASLIRGLTRENILTNFRIPGGTIPGSSREPDGDLYSEYVFDPFRTIAHKKGRSL